MIVKASCLIKTIPQSFKVGIEHPVIFLALEPGYLPTRLTDGSGTNVMATRIKGVMKIMENATIEDRGSFFEYTGEKIPF